MNFEARNIRMLLAGLLVGTMAAGLGACASQQDTSEADKVVEKSQIEKLSEELEMSEQALRSFQEAQEGLKAKKPDYRGVQTKLEEAIELEPDFVEAHYNLGIVHLTLNENAEAIPHLRKAHDLDPGILEYTVALAQGYAAAEQYTKARTMFQEVVARQPGNLTAKNNLAAMAMREGDDEQALEFVRDVLRDDNQNVGALNILGLIYRKRGNLSLAKYAFQKGLRVGSGEGEESDDGDEDSESGDETEQKTADKESDSSESSGSDSEESSKDDTNAQKASSSKTKDAESGGTDSKKAKSKQASASDQSGSDSDSKDVGDPEKEVEAASSDAADLHNNLGLVYLKEDDVPSAVDEFEEAIEADPNYLESRLNIGAILLDYLDYERAHTHFTEAVRIAPNNCVAHLGLGAAAFATTNYKSSADNFQYYVDNCDSEHVSSYERLATLYESHLQDKSKAVEYYERLIELVDDEEKVADYKATKNFLQNQLESEAQKTDSQEGDEQTDGQSSDDGADTDGEDSQESAPAETPDSESDGANGADKSGDSGSNGSTDGESAQ
jgi:tetratricopeptide (TPR) repeat protein